MNLDYSAVEYNEDGNCKAPDSVFDAVANAVQTAASGLPNKVKVRIDKEYQGIRLINKHGHATIIIALWHLGFWNIEGEHNSRDHKKKVSNKCQDVGEVLNFISLCIPELNLASTSYKPSKVYPEGEQQMLCL